MDEKRMSLSLVIHFGSGILLGVIYFRGLWWNARLLASGGHLATSIALLLGRFALLGGLLTLVSLEGAMPLLVMAMGILVARYVVMRGLRDVRA
jgi:F1F0 ATPase subunit 2